MCWNVFKIGLISTEWADALLLCSSIPLKPLLGPFTWIFCNTAARRQAVVYRCAITVLLFSRATLATYPLIEKKIATISFLTCPGPFTFRIQAVKAGRYRFHRPSQCLPNSYSNYFGIGAVPFGTSNCVSPGELELSSDKGYNEESWKH